MAYVELHARSAFSFLRGGSLPEAVMREAARLGMPAVALCDRDGVYGAVRLHMAGREAGVRALVGAEITMEDGSVVPVLVATRDGYRGLCALLTTAHLRSEKGEGRVSWAELAEARGGLVALTGDEEGPVRRAWEEKGSAAAGVAASRLASLFGTQALYAEIQRHRVPGEERWNGFLADWAAAAGVPLLATNGVLHAARDDACVADVFACLRGGVTLDTAGKRLLANRERHLKGTAEMEELFRDLPEAVANTGRLAGRLEFTLRDLGYRFPEHPVPAGESQDSFLRKMAYFGAQQRYGSLAGEVRRQIDRELALIAKLGFSGYFLTVWDLCAYARDRGSLVQGRGSAANSAVCYALGITAVDPIASKLLFERFLSEGRTDWPDIDLDLPSGERREEVIQEVYRRYGRRGAAMTANVITYRGRSAIREVGKAMGFPDDALDRFSGLFHGGDLPQTLGLGEQLRMAGVPEGHPRLRALVDTSRRVLGLPRHLGQHSGGMVMSSSGLDMFVPLENARMAGRSVLQWDKSDIEDMGLLKVDFLGLGMMAALQDAVEICAARGQPVDLARIPKDDPAVFRLLREADTVGIFQVESRAQMSTLPRMKPETFYDLAVEVAIIRPGPIQGDAVNPYLRRRSGEEPVTYPDERARPILERTLGVVLFQEQILRLAMELGGFTASEADELRRAIGFTRSQERLDRMKDRLAAAFRRNAVAEPAVEYLIRSLASFALYGFPESHAISFALIAYASAWLKVNRPAAFYASLLNCQPMGFYSPATLVQDGKRRGITFLPPCVQASDARCRVDSDASVRLGIGGLKGVRMAAVGAMLAARGAGPFASLADFLARTGFTAAELRVLAGSGALNSLAGDRRSALWRVEAFRGGDDLLANADPVDGPAPLGRMTLLERLGADYLHLSLTTGAHPMRLVRPRLPPGVRTAGELPQVPAGSRVAVCGAVITRQRPGTAKGFCFITLEDETGLANAIVRPALFEKRRLVINLEPALMITGRLQNEQGVVHVMADEVAGMPDLGIPEQPSHDFR
jgi:error-prone DNA polymerase